MNYSGQSRVVNIGLSLNNRICLHYITFMVICQYVRINSQPMQHRLVKNIAIKMLVLKKKPVRLMWIALGFIEVLSEDGMKSKITTRSPML